MLLIFLWLGISNLSAQSISYFITNYPSTAYQSQSYTSSPQNWCVIQAPTGMMFFSNGNLILAFDGKTWQAVKGTADKSFLKMAMDKEGRIFTGGSDDLGWIGADSSGRLCFYSMLDKLPSDAREFSRIRNVCSDAEGNVFFMGNDTQLTWDGHRMHVLKAQTEFRRLASTAGKCYLQIRDQGLHVWEHGGWKQLKGSMVMDSLDIRGIYQAEYKGNGGFWVVTKDQGLFRWAEGILLHIPKSLDEMNVWNGTPVNDSTIALATDAHGLVLMNLNTLEEERIDESNGLYFNSILYPYVDLEGSIWVASDIGLSRITYPAYLKAVNPPAKAKLMVHSMALLDGKYFLGTMYGCWVMELSANQPQFRKLEGMTDLVRALVPFQGGMLIASATDGIFWWKKGQVTQISKRKATALHLSKSVPGQVMVGLDTGLALLQWDGRQWLDLGDIEGIAHAVYHIAEEGDAIWAGFHEVSLLNYNKQAQTWAVTAMDSMHGFEESHGELDPFEHEGKVYFGTERGIFQYQENTRKLTATKDFGSWFADQGHAAHSVFQDRSGDLWLNDGRHTGRLSRGRNGQWDWDPLPFRSMEDQEVWCIFADESEKVWIGTTTTLYLFSPKQYASHTAPFRTLIRQVAINDTIVLFNGQFADSSGLLLLAQPSGTAPVLPYDQNQVAFSLAATSYFAPEKTEFTHWLEGMEEGWSAWTTESEISYNNLSEGKYVLHARARNLYDQLGAETRFAFQILPPWYRTWLAFLAYVVLSATAVVLIVWWQVKRITLRQQKVQAIELARERALLQASVEAQENERTRIAKDLHDGIQVTLSTAKLKLNMLRNALRKSGLDESGTVEPVELIQDAISGVRSISRDLMPATLPMLGLCHTLAELCKKVDSGDQLKVTFEVWGTERRFAVQKELAIFRVIQELFANSLKHAEASRINLIVQFFPEHITVSFEDNGRGFDISKLNAMNSGLGFKNMEGRMRLAGGSFKFESEPEKGARFWMEVKVD